MAKNVPTTPYDSDSEWENILTPPPSPSRSKTSEVSDISELNSFNISDGHEDEGIANGGSCSTAGLKPTTTCTNPGLDASETATYRQSENMTEQRKSVEDPRTAQTICAEPTPVSGTAGRSHNALTEEFGWGLFTAMGVDRKQLESVYSIPDSLGKNIAGNVRGTTPHPAKVAQAADNEKTPVVAAGDSSLATLETGSTPRPKPLSVVPVGDSDETRHGSARSVSDLAASTENSSVSGATQSSATSGDQALSAVEITQPRSPVHARAGAERRRANFSLKSYDEAYEARRKLVDDLHRRSDNVMRERGRELRRQNERRQAEKNEKLEEQAQWYEGYKASLGGKEKKHEAFLAAERLAAGKELETTRLVTKELESAARAEEFKRWRERRSNDDRFQAKWYDPLLAMTMVLMVVMCWMAIDSEQHRTAQFSTPANITVNASTVSSEASQAKPSSIFLEQFCLDPDWATHFESVTPQSWPVLYKQWEAARYCCSNYAALPSTSPLSCAIQLETPLSMDIDSAFIRPIYPNMPYALFIETVELSKWNYDNLEFLMDRLDFAEAAEPATVETLLSSLKTSRHRKHSILEYFYLDLATEALEASEAAGCKSSYETASEKAADGLPSPSKTQLLPEKVDLFSVKEGFSFELPVGFSKLSIWQSGDRGTFCNLTTDDGVTVHGNYSLRNCEFKASAVEGAKRRVEEIRKHASLKDKLGWSIRKLVGTKFNEWEAQYSKWRRDGYLRSSTRQKQRYQMAA